MNMVRTFILMALMTFILVALGNVFGGRTGMIVAVGFALVMNGVSYWFSDRIVLMMYGAKEVTRDEAPDLYWIVKDLVDKAGLPMPRLYIIDSATPNAFATGRSHNHAAVAVTTGIMRMLDKREMTGVLAHELSHVKHYDMLIGSVAGTIVGAISALAQMGQWALIFGGLGGGDRDREGGGLGALLLLILAPIIATLLQLAVSRRREFSADRGAALMTGDPLSLAHALRKISAGNEMRPMRSGPATAHLFIVNPLSGRSLMNLFSTHPSTEDRVAKLEKMAAEGVK